MEKNRKIALVTGGSRGIGRAVCEMLAGVGYHTVILCHRNRPAAESLATALTARGLSCEVMQADVSDDAAVRSLAADILARHGALSVLVNCAGIAQSGLLTDFSEQDCARIMDVNFGGVLHTCRAFYHAMVQQRAGVIVNIASIWGESGASCEAVYSASKGAVIAFSKALAAELAPSGVRVCCVSPGVIDTDMMKSYSEDDRRALCRETPLGRLGTPDDVARAVQYLIEADFVTGCVLRVDGGFLAL